MGEEKAVSWKSLSSCGEYLSTAGWLSIDIAAPQLKLPTNGMTLLLERSSDGGNTEEDLQKLLLRMLRYVWLMVGTCQVFGKIRLLQTNKLFRAEFTIWMNNWKFPEHVPKNLNLKKLQLLEVSLMTSSNSKVVGMNNYGTRCFTEYLCHLLNRAQR